MLLHNECIFCCQILVAYLISINMSNEGYLKRKAGFATAAIHGGNEPEKWNCRAVVPGLFMSTTYKQDAPAEHRVSRYVRE